LRNGGSFPIIADMSLDEPSSTTENQDGARHYVLGTAGHIDHGKTSLIRALTGTDTDRLPEEQRRGMTIELGFAELKLDDVTFGIVDVPGHERFVRTMVAGATGIDLALIVVAADDSVMPQTKEHVDILHLLGVSRGVVAVTKIDTVEPDMVDLVVEEVSELLDGTPLQDAPIERVSSITGEGIDKLKASINQVSRRVPRGPTGNPFRMFVDRVFALQGRGTVVTGSVQRGAVASGDTLQHFPGGETCRVRDMQAHGVSETTLGSGQRAALNLSGIDRDHIRRGSELAAPGYLQPSHMIDAKLHCLPSHSKGIRSACTVRMELGTTEQPVRVVLLEGGVLLPDESAYAQLRCGETITVTYGQRFIIRDETASRTIGGGLVLRPVSRRRRRAVSEERGSLTKLETGDDDDRVEEALRFAGFTQLTDLQVCARAGVELDGLADIYARLERNKRWVTLKGTDVRIVPAARDDLTDRVIRWLERYHKQHPEMPGRLVDTLLGYLERMTDRSLAKAFFEGMIRSKKIKLIGRFACLPAFAPELTPSDEKLMNSLIEELRAAGFQPPALTELQSGKQADRKRLERLATLAVALGELVKVDAKMYLHAEVERRLRAAVTEMVEKTGGVTLSEMREALQSTRKYTVPIMEYLDRAGFTKRDGDKRVLANVPDKT